MGGGEDFFSAALFPFPEFFPFDGFRVFSLPAQGVYVRSNADAIKGPGPPSGACAIL